MTELEKALTLVRAAGYRVTKPKPKKRDRVGPTFVAEFADGEVTRMSTFTALDKLDWQRGVRLAQAAYESRSRQRELAIAAADAESRPLPRSLPPFPPPIIAARFEQDGKVLAEYDRPSKWAEAA